MNGRYSLARARLKTLNRVREALLGPMGGTVADTGIRTIDESCFEPAVAAHVLERAPLCDATVARWDFPAAFPPQFRRSKAFDARALYRLADVCVSPATGLAWLPEGRILEESVGALRRVVGWGDLLHEPLLATPPLAGAEPVVTCAPTNFYHFLAEALPGYLAAREHDPTVRLLLPSATPGYVDTLLAELPGGARVVRADGPVQVPELLLPAVDPFSGFVHPDIPALLRRTFAHLLVTSAPRPAIYVSRRRAARRALSGEDELEERLVARGFQVVFAEDLTLPEQIRLFASARAVVAPHGAGLTNLLWADRPGLVVEIHPLGTFNDCYARLALDRGLDYRYADAETSDASGSGRVPVRAVLDTLDRAGRVRSA